jgi:hypothetical protein
MGNATAELGNLPPQERAVCYRELAKQAEGWAEKSPECRESYRFLAEQWNVLADQIGRNHAKDVAHHLPPSAAPTLPSGNDDPESSPRARSAL